MNLRYQLYHTFATFPNTFHFLGELCVRQLRVEGGPSLGCVCDPKASGQLDDAALEARLFTDGLLALVGPPAGHRTAELIDCQNVRCRSTSWRDPVLIPSS
jgi:hypothetical protein